MLSLPALLRLPLCCRAGVAHDGPGEPRHPEDCALEATLLSPRELLAARVVFTPAAHAQIALCRGEHNRLGLAYQMAFLRLTGRFPSQPPLALLPDVLAVVAGALALAPTVIEASAQRQATVSAHQEQIRRQLGFRAFGPAKREGLRHCLRQEALHRDHRAAWVAPAEALLRDPQVRLPALSTRRRLAGAQRDWTRQRVAPRRMALVPPELPARREALLHVEAAHRLSPLHERKPPPGMPPPQAVSRLTAKLDGLQTTGVLTLDLTWRNPQWQPAWARQAAQARGQRRRLLDAPQRSPVRVCVLMQTYHAPLDQRVERADKRIPATYRRAQRRLAEAVKRHRHLLRTTLQSFHPLGHTLGNEQGAPEAVRVTVLQQMPPERLQAQRPAAQPGRRGDTSAVFPLVMKRSRSLRQCAPTLLEQLPVDRAPTGAPARLDAVALLRDLNTTGRRPLPAPLPDTCLPKRWRACGETNGTTNRRAYEGAVWTALRDEIKRGNVWMRGSPCGGQLDDCFLPDAAGATRRQDFFRTAGVPVVPTAAAAWLPQRLNAA